MGASLNRWSLMPERTKETLVCCWLESLSNNKYKQSKSFLRSRNGTEYSPFGVLCDVYDNTKWNHEYVKSRTCNLVSEFSYEWNLYYPPIYLLKLIDLPESSVHELLNLNLKKNFSLSNSAEWLIFRFYNNFSNRIK